MNEREIITQRLRLVPLTREQLEHYLDREELFTDDVGLASRAILTPILQKAIRMKLLKLDRSSPQNTAWITYWLIKVPPAGFGAGMIGFKGVPDESGQVEIGYGIDPGYQNMGYITEAVKVMAGWAFQDKRCKRIAAPETLRSNPASNRVLEKCGFSIYQETAESISWRLDREDEIRNL